MKEKIKRIKVLALDVDGVLTDGKIIFDSLGQEVKIFNVHDGFGLVMLKKAGFKTAILTARASKAVEFRVRDLNIDKLYQDAHPKIHAYQQMLNEFAVKDGEVCFVGDDLPDLQILKRVGFAVVPPNAVAEVQKAADYITKNRGGQGAVREVVELILKTQGKWEKTVGHYFD